MKPTRLLFRPLAEAQIIEAFNSYTLSSKQRAQSWMEALDVAFTSIEHFPLSYAVLFDEVRRVKIKDFPYLLLFFVEEQSTQKEAVVVAYVHERSDPQTWRKMNE